MTPRSCRLSEPVAHAEWLPAAPFRSHVRRLIDASGLPWRAVALAARVPPKVVKTLLHGRHGRARPRLPRVAAQQLMLLTEDSLLALRRRRESGWVLHAYVRRLLRAGFDVDDVAVLLRVDPSRLESLTAGAGCATDAYTVLLARAACDALCPDDSDPAYATLDAEPVREPAPVSTVPVEAVRPAVPQAA